MLPTAGLGQGRCSRNSSAPEHPLREGLEVPASLSIPHQHPLGFFSFFFLSKQALQLSHPLCSRALKSSLPQLLCQEGIISITLGRGSSEGRGCCSRGWAGLGALLLLLLTRISQRFPHANELHLHKPPGKQVKVVIFILQRQNRQ